MALNRGIKKEDDKIEINISPMIDMVFILLIFFIVTTVFVEEVGLDANRPDPSAEQQADEEDEQVIFRVTNSNRVLFRGSEIGLNNVRSTVRRELNDMAEDPVIVEVEEAAPAGTMVRVLDEARIAGAAKTSITEAGS